MNSWGLLVNVKISYIYKHIDSEFTPSKLIIHLQKSKK